MSNVGGAAVAKIATELLASMHDNRFPERWYRGAGYGAYADGTVSGVKWCACFASMCMEAAGLRRYSDWNCTNMIRKLMADGRYDCTAVHGGGNYRPRPGDLVFFNAAYNGAANVPNTPVTEATHVGIVYEYTDAGNFRTLEGNVNDQCATRLFHVSNPYVIGFGNIQF